MTERIGKLPNSARPPSALGHAAVRGLHPGYACFLTLGSANSKHFRPIQALTLQAFEP